MTVHKVTAPVTGGKARARHVQGDDRRPDYHATVSTGEWSCSCGKENMSDEEAAEHLRNAE